jgi:hypothetical protein
MRYKTQRHTEAEMGGDVALAHPWLVAGAEPSCLVEADGSLGG